MWRGHGGGDGAVLGARSAHCSAEKGVMSGVFGPSSSRTVSARGPSLLSPAFIAREGLEEEEVVELRNALLLRDKQIGHEAWAAAALGGGRA